MTLELQVRHALTYVRLMVFKDVAMFMNSHTWDKVQKLRKYPNYLDYGVPKGDLMDVTPKDGVPKRKSDR